MITTAMLRRAGPVCVLLVLAASPASGEASLASRIDAIVTSPITAGRVAGMSVAVVKGTETIAEKAYGLADLQLDVPTPPRAVYEIGSVTKQFTAAAILLLAADGKLSLDDELTRHLPDYPTQGHHVTIRHLLNHTSGIKSYTDLPDFRSLAIQKRPRQELVQLFSSQPFDFAPGEEVIYNNSGFFLLGLIIEEVSGTPYEEFVRTRLFDRAGMKDSSYCSERQIRKNKVQGYDVEKETLVLKAYLDHTWPYAAGSLCSTAHDLVLWNRALHGGRLLKPAWLHHDQNWSCPQDGGDCRVDTAHTSRCGPTARCTSAGSRTSSARSIGLSLSS